jgi:chaperone required for assembly of F1-ATPase
MKRFYKEVTVAEVASGYEVRLDGKSLRTPAKAPLLLPGRALADAIAAEWAAQGDRVAPNSMPLMQFASTAIDRVGPQRDSIVEAVARYAETDLLCYRADFPTELADRQAQVWQPILDWAALRYDAPLLVNVGIMPKPQPADACRALRRAVEKLDDMVLSGVQNATSCCGSLILALALLEGRIDAEEAFAAAELDETFQIEQWGEDAEAAQRRTNLRADIMATQRFLELVQS